jgi:hypothetical protein
MDPQATWQSIVDIGYQIDLDSADPTASMATEDLCALGAHIRDLNEWLKKGGHPPKGCDSTQEIEDMTTVEEIKREYGR